jgi:hypothetical protein
MATITISGNTGATYSGCDETQLRENQATTNFANDTTFNVTAWDTGDRKHTVMKFTGLSNVGAGTVTNAKIRLYCVANNGNNPTTQVYALRRNFVESQATWNIYSTGNNWGTAGALNTTSDYNNSLLASQLITTTGQYYEFSGAAVDAYVQAIVSGGSDFGLLLIDSGFAAPAALDHEANYRSTEGTDAQRPELVFDHTAAGGGSVNLMSGKFGMKLVGKL